MKCKYCKTKIGIIMWVFCFGKCDDCEYEIWSRNRKRRREDSKKYWEKEDKK